MCHIMTLWKRDHSAVALPEVSFHSQPIKGLFLEGLGVECVVSCTDCKVINNIGQGYLCWLSAYFNLLKMIKKIILGGFSAPITHFSLIYQITYSGSTYIVGTLLVCTMLLNQSCIRQISGQYKRVKFVLTRHTEQTVLTE